MLNHIKNISRQIFHSRSHLIHSFVMKCSALHIFYVFWVSDNFHHFSSAALLLCTSCALYGNTFSSRKVETFSVDARRFLLLFFFLTNMPFGTQQRYSVSPKDVSLCKNKFQRWWFAVWIPCIRFRVARKLNLVFFQIRGSRMHSTHHAVHMIRLLSHQRHLILYEFTMHSSSALQLLIWVLLCGAALRNPIIILSKTFW